MAMCRGILAPMSGAPLAAAVLAQAAKVVPGGGPGAGWAWGFALAFAACAAFQFALWGGVFGRLYRRLPGGGWRPPGTAEGQGPSAEGGPAVSIVVCARNELGHLRRHLPLWLDQEGPDHELLLVDDASTDGSAEWLAAQCHARLRVIRLEEGEKPLPGKKGALTVGIRAARAPWLLLTDADCRPASRCWLAGMADAMRPGVDLVLGVGATAGAPGPLNAWVRWETAHTAIQYLGWALAGLPYMGVGRNLAYRKAVWEGVGGFAAHGDWPSGDDDLFVASVARPGRVAAVWKGSAQTLTQAPPDPAAWRRQRRRHFSTGGRYPVRARLALGADAVSQFGLYAGLFAGLLTGHAIPWLLAILALRWALQALLLRRLMPAFGAAQLWHFSTIFDLGTVLRNGTFVRTMLAPRRAPWR
jgi:biofilm PGA synthesis N-glycosyltransferase PgaC